jgi:hypothetical protein
MEKSKKVKVNGDQQNQKHDLLQSEKMRYKHADQIYE